MNSRIKVPVSIELRAGDVLVAVCEDATLWSYILGEIIGRDHSDDLDGLVELAP